MNGHFMGQDYLLKSMMVSLNLDLSELDPDNADEDDEDGADGFMRTDVLFAMLPTTFGLWFDSWNVKAFLLDERARLYAEKFKDPQYCTYCGYVHVPYQDLIKSTSKTVSLCWQLFPLIGIIMGKVCEYCNFPPVYYRGTAMPCLYTQDMFSYKEYPELPPLKRKAGGVKKAMRSMSKCLIKFVREKLGMVRSALSLYLLFTAFFFVFFVTIENIAVVVPLLGFAFIAAQVKGLGDLSLWVWINFICTSSSKSEKALAKAEKAEKKLEQKRQRAKNPENAGMLMRAWILMGGTWGTSITILWSFQDMEARYLLFRAIMGTIIAIAYNLFTATLSILSNHLERIAAACPGICRFLMYACPIGTVFILAMRVTDFRASCIIALVTFCLQITIDWTHLEGKAHHMPKTLEGYIPGLVAIPLGTFIGGLSGMIFIVVFQSPFGGWALGFWIGTMISLSAGIGMTIILNNKPFIYGLKWGLLVGFIAFVLSGPQAGLVGFVLGGALVALKTEWLVFDEYQAEFKHLRNGKPRKVFKRLSDLKAEAVEEARLNALRYGTKGSDTESTMDSTASLSVGSDYGLPPIGDMTEESDERVRDIDDKELTKQELREQIKALSGEVSLSINQSTNLSTSIGNTSADEWISELRLPGSIPDHLQHSLQESLQHSEDEENFRRGGGAALDQPDVETFFESEMNMTDVTETAPEPPPIPSAPPLPLEPYEEERRVVVRNLVFDTSGRPFDPRHAPATETAEEGTPAGTPRRLMARQFDEPPENGGGMELSMAPAGATRLSLGARGRMAREANAQHRRASRVHDAWSSPHQRAGEDWRQRDYGTAPSKPRGPAGGKRYR
jgi:hypothetical protein